MIFVIQYYRTAGRIDRIEEFPDSQHREADLLRVQLELEAAERARRSDVEVVMLEARDLQALRLTHRRYFADLRELTAYDGAAA